MSTKEGFLERRGTCKSYITKIVLAINFQVIDFVLHSIAFSDKNELISILKVLKKFKINIISSGGTYSSIKKLGYDCMEVSKYTGFKVNN